MELYLTSTLQVYPIKIRSRRAWKILITTWLDMVGRGLELFDHTSKCLRESSMPYTLPFLQCSIPDCVILF